MRLKISKDLKEPEVVEVAVEAEEIRKLRTEIELLEMSLRMPEWSFVDGEEVSYRLDIKELEYRIEALSKL